MIFPHESFGQATHQIKVYSISGNQNCDGSNIRFLYALAQVFDIGLYFGFTILIENWRIIVKRVKKG